MGAGPSCSGQYGRSSSNPGTPLSSRDLRRSSYDSSRNQYNSSNPYRRGNQFYTPPASWSQAPMRGQQAQLDQSGGRYSAGHSWYGQGGRGPPSHDYYGNAQSRDPRLHHRPQPPPPRVSISHRPPFHCCFVLCGFFHCCSYLVFVCSSKSPSIFVSNIRACLSRYMYNVSVEPRPFITDFQVERLANLSLVCIHCVTVKL